MTTMSDKANKLLLNISKEYLVFIRTAQYRSNDEEIHLKDINYFNTNTSKKQKNDKNNKKREHIISSIINSETPKTNLNSSLDSIFLINRPLLNVTRIYNAFII